VDDQNIHFLANQWSHHRQRVSAESPFPSEAEADINGMTFGQRMVDNKIAGLSLK
jgi:hypothetical protein